MPYEKAKIIRMPINQPEARQAQNPVTVFNEDRPIKPSPNQQYFGNIEQFMKNDSSS